MTPQQISELNERIAVNVFGCKPVKIAIKSGRKTIRHIFECHCENHKHADGGSDGLDHEIPDYTQPAAHAELIGKIVEKCGGIAIEKTGSLYVAGTPLDYAEDMTETLPLAVMKLAGEIEWK